MVWLGIYIAAAVFLGILAFLSRKEGCFTKEPITGAEAVLRRMAVYLYRRGGGCRIGRKRGKAMQSVLAEQVRGDITVLHPCAKPERELARHRIRQLQTGLTFLAAADLIAIALWISERQQTYIRSGGIIDRPGYGEASVTVRAKATGNTEEGKVDYGEYEIVVDSRKYTEKEAEALAQTVLEALESKISGENQSLGYVTQNLNLMRELDPYPFRISWESSCCEVVDTDGTVFADQLEKGEHQRVQLTATLAYEGRTWSRTYEIMVFHRASGEEEDVHEKVMEELEQQEADAEQSTYLLPTVIEGVRIQWEELREESNQMMFLLILGAGVLAASGMDQELHKRVQKRDREMALDYPLIVSKMTLFLGAGMSVRNIFYRLGEDYQEKRQKGGGRRYVYEEIILVCRELDSGISETSAYAAFGRRCHSRQYAKLSTLLTANQTKGNSTLLKILQEEADHSLEERRGIARQMGEEAGTKLLLPMLMMLGITLVIIMIPAYFSFSI